MLMKSQANGVRNMLAIRMAATYQAMTPTLMRRRRRSTVWAVSDCALACMLFPAQRGFVVDPPRACTEDRNGDHEDDDKGYFQQGAAVAKQLIAVELLECIDHEKRIALGRRPGAHAPASAARNTPGRNGYGLHIRLQGAYNAGHHLEQDHRT